MAPQSYQSYSTNFEGGPATWQFVHVAKPIERQSSDTRYLVRQHVMKGIYQKKRLSRDKIVQPRKIACRKRMGVAGEVTTTQSGASICNCVECEDEYSNYERYPIGLRRYRSTNEKVREPQVPSQIYNKAIATIEKGLPAYPRYPIKMKPYMHELINHFAVHLAPILLDTADFHRSWIRARIPITLSNRMLLHALLFAASAHRDTLRGTDASLMTIAHRGQVLRFINEDINGSIDGPSDASIAAVLKLANFEEVLNDLQTSQLHRRAVQQMVSARGGLVRIMEKDRQLANMILVSDMMCVALNTSRPLFLQPEVWLSPCYPNSSIIFPIRPLQNCESRLSIKRATGLSDTFIDIHYELQAATALLQSSNDPSISDSDPQLASCRLPNYFTILNTLLAPPILNPSSPSLPNTTFFISETIRLATVLYLSAITTLTPFPSPLHTPLVISLKLAMQRTNIQTSWSAIPETLMWACLVGAAAAGDRPERGWFVAVLGPVMMALGAARTREVEASMVVFGWVVRGCEEGGGENGFNEGRVQDGGLEDQIGWADSVLAVRSRE